MIISTVLHLSEFVDMQPRLGSELSCGSQHQAYRPRAWIKLHRLESPSVESEPKTERRDVNASASRIKRRDLNRAAVFLDIPSECQPSELRMMNEISGGVPGVTEKVRAIVAGERIRFQHVRKCVKRGRSKTFLIDVGERAYGSSITHAQ